VLQVINTGTVEGGNYVETVGLVLVALAVTTDVGVAVVTEVFELAAVLAAEDWGCI